MDQNQPISTLRLSSCCRGLVLAELPAFSLGESKAFLAFLLRFFFPQRDEQCSFNSLHPSSLQPLRGFPRLSSEVLTQPFPQVLPPPTSHSLRAGMWGTITNTATAFSHSFLPLKDPLSFLFMLYLSILDFETWNSCHQSWSRGYYQPGHPHLVPVCTCWALGSLSSCLRLARLLKVSLHCYHQSNPVGSFVFLICPQHHQISCCVPSPRSLPMPLGHL